MSQKSRRRGLCSRCGKRTTRTVKVLQTLNPFNRSPKGIPKTRKEIAAEFSAELAEELKAPLLCRFCESVSPVDAEERNRRYPETFPLPHLQSRMTLREGDYAKIIIGGRERLWMLITEAGNGAYTGRLANDPVSIPLARGDRVGFAARHIIDIQRKPQRRSP
jgi:hypothetical protein